MTTPITFVTCPLCKGRIYPESALQPHIAACEQRHAAFLQMVESLRVSLARVPDNFELGKHAGAQFRHGIINFRRKRRRTKQTKSSMPS
jgi:hypothetical protein